MNVLDVDFIQVGWFQLVIDTSLEVELSCAIVSGIENELTINVDLDIVIIECVNNVEMEPSVVDVISYGLSIHSIQSLNPHSILIIKPKTSLEPAYFN
jgi:hypothetical protein